MQPQNNHQNDRVDNDPMGLIDSETWVFDLDNTLYHPASNIFDQMRVRMGEFISEYLDVDLDEAYRLQKTRYRPHGTTLCGLMAVHGLDPHLFLNFVHDIDLDVLAPNPELGRLLDALPGRKVIYTNATTEHADRVTERLGIADYFEAVFDIAAADYVPKPMRDPYRVMADRHAIRPERAVMIEDMAVNLGPAHEMGMVTVLLAPTAGTGDAGAEHIHHVIEDLTGWLAEVVAAP